MSAAQPLFAIPAFADSSGTRYLTFLVKPASAFQWTPGFQATREYSRWNAFSQNHGIWEYSSSPFRAFVVFT